MIVHRVAGLSLTAPDVELGRRSVFAHLWPSGVVLAEQIAGALGGLVSGRAVIELGCGLGAVGIAAARAGGRVTLTDAEDDALALAERNAHACGVAVDVRALRWGEDPGELAGAFEVVLGADLAYEPRQRRPLLATIEAVLAPGGVAWLADPGRTSRRELAHQTSLMVEVWGRFAPPLGLTTSDGSEGRDVVIYRLGRT